MDFGKKRQSTININKFVVESILVTKLQDEVVNFEIDIILPLNYFQLSRPVRDLIC